MRADQARFHQVHSFTSCTDSAAPTAPRRFPRRHAVLWIFLGLFAFLAAKGLDPPHQRLMPFTPFSPQASREPFSFIVYGDIQGNYKEGHNALVKQMLRERAAFIINTGDISPHKGKHYVRDFYPVVQALARRVPFLPSIGNHDVAWGSPFSRYSFRTFFDKSYNYLGRQPGNGHLLEPTSQKLWYSFNYGKALFIVLDSNFFIKEGKYRRTHALKPYRDHLEEQLVWVRDLLEKSSCDPNIHAKFVFFHHSPFCSDEKNPVPLLGFGGHPGHREMVVNQKVPSRRLGDESFLLDLFRYHRVTAVFTGHEHYYERWREVILEKKRPIHVVNWVVTGLGGVKPRGRPYYKKRKITKLLKKERVYRHYLKRITAINPDWTAKLEHPYPTEENKESRFHNYVLVKLEGSQIRFQTKDIRRKIRDEGFF